MKKRWLRSKLRLIVVAVFLAAAILLASRVNRTPEVSFDVPRLHPIFEEVLPDVSLDVRTLQTALAGLAVQIKTKIVIDPELAVRLDRQFFPAGGPVIEHYAHIRLGVLIARLLEEQNERCRVHCRVDGAALVFCLPSCDGYCGIRDYDMRTMEADWVKWSAHAKSWDPPIPSAPPKKAPDPDDGIFLGGGDSIREGTRRQETPLDFIHRAIGVDEQDFQVVENWSGQLMIKAGATTHRSLEQFFALWNQDDSLRRGGAEIPIYRFGDLPGITTQWPSVSKTDDENRLLRILPRVKCSNTPLETLIAHLAKSTSTNIFVDWHNLAARAAVGAPSPITLDLQNVTLKSALLAAIDQATKSAAHAQIISADGLIKVSFPSMLEQWTVRIYDVRDLIERQSVPSDTLFEESTARIDGPPVRYRTSIEERKWRALTGMLAWPRGARLRYFAGKIAVFTNRENHELLAQSIAKNSRGGAIKRLWGWIASNSMLFGMHDLQFTLEIIRPPG